MKIIPDSGFDKAPRADMYLPTAIFGFGIFLAVCGVACVVGAILFFVGFAVIALPCFALAVLSILCWKNQSIRIIDDNTFEVTTFLGKTKRYSFSDITRVRQNNDSYTIFVGDGKVHVEMIAVVTERFFAKLGEAFDRCGA